MDEREPDSIDDVRRRLSALRWEESDYQQWLNPQGDPEGDTCDFALPRRGMLGKSRAAISRLVECTGLRPALNKFFSFVGLSLSL